MTKVTWTGGMAFEAETSTGQKIIMDASEEFGGSNSGARPNELLLVGLGGCTGMDVVAILEKKRQLPVSFRMEIEGDRRSEHPKAFTNIRIRYYFKGEGLAEEAVARAINLSQEKYCSSAATLRGVAGIEYTFEIEK
ncbi:MAG: OsmC family protein [Myxococcota bacterium]|jgi:putative redox protein